MAVPVLVMIGRERTATGTVDDQILIEAESLAEIAMRRD
jgi:ATP-dependent Lhr-like helicase